MTKKQEILNYMHAWGLIDKHIALTVFGNYSLGEYIRLLRKKYRITTYYFSQPSVIKKCVYLFEGEIEQ